MGFLLNNLPVLVKTVKRNLTKVKKNKEFQNNSSRLKRFGTTKCNLSQECKDVLMFKNQFNTIYHINKLNMKTYIIISTFAQNIF